MKNIINKLELKVKYNILLHKEEYNYICENEEEFNKYIDNIKNLDVYENIKSSIEDNYIYLEYKVDNNYILKFIFINNQYNISIKEIKN